jgi:hypothetical protein
MKLRVAPLAGKYDRIAEIDCRWRNAYVQAVVFLLNFLSQTSCELQTTVFFFALAYKAFIACY